jgi:hypothetical protein
LEDVDWLAFGLETFVKDLEALAERWRPFAFEVVNWLALTLAALDKALEVLDEQGRPLIFDLWPLGPPFRRRLRSSWNLTMQNNFSVVFLFFFL